MVTNIYLIPTETGYRAEAAWNAPAKDAILLTRERAYPVPIWAKRITKNLNHTLHFESANSQHELICKINALGREGAELQKVWDYYGATDEMMGESLRNLFNSCAKFRRDEYEKARMESTI